METWWLFSIQLCSKCVEVITKILNNKFAEIISDNYKIALKESWVIGDKDSDILFGKLSNCKTIRISSSYTKEDKSNYFVNNLLEASNKILNHS